MEEYTYEDSNTKLVNIKEHDDYDVYIGSENELLNLEESVFSNPFDTTKKSEIEMIENYKVYFYRRYLSDSAFREQVNDLCTKTLGDIGSPHKSHGSVIVDVVYRYEKGGLEQVLKYIKQEYNNIDTKLLRKRGLKKKESLSKLVNKLQKEMNS